MSYLKHSIFFFVIFISLFTFGCEADNTASSGSSSSAPSVKKAPPIPALQPGEEIVVIETDFGKVKVQLFPDVAPRHVENFKKLINEGFYNGLAFHRAVPNLIVQGGDPNTRDKPRETWGMGDESLPKVNAEFSDRPFVKGTLGAARASDPNSASTQFFLCAGPFPQWDGQYTNFGQIIEGISNVQVMTMAPTEADEKLKDKIVMRKVYLEKYAGK
jgi:cyclophilin family peptidyl-prolyl cis-trans isomerase